MAYPQYLWYKTFPNENAGGNITRYQDRALLMSFQAELLLSSEEDIEKERVIQKNSSVAQRKRKKPHTHKGSPQRNE